MTVLFSMRHAGALRNFSSTIEELARRGHRVHLTFLTHDKLADDRLLTELTTRYPQITSGGVTPVSRDRWLGLARRARAIADAVRYAAPEFAQADALRARAQGRIPEGMRSLLQSRLGARPAVRRLLGSVTTLIDRVAPPNEGVTAVIRANRPDVVLVTPLVDFGSDQIEYVKAAVAVRVPVGVCVHSWDNLTTKGLIRVVPDRVYVWNEVQRTEAAVLHDVPPDRVVVTGAPVYDQWFARRPSSTRAEFCARVGLPDERPFILYLCSSPFIAPDEIAFLTRWLAAVRSASDPSVRSAAVVIRPHPSADPRIWSRFDAAQFEHVVVWPNGGANPVDAASKTDYFDSMYHAAVAFGINTSAQIEAGIVGRRVFSVRVPECVNTQENTLHFQYLLRESGGLVRMDATLAEHVAALGDALRPNAEAAERLRAFVRGFVRPAGLDVPATPRLVDAIEQLAQLPARAPESIGIGLHVWRMLLLPLATLVPAAPEKNRSVRKAGAASGNAASGRRAGAGV